MCWSCDDDYVDERDSYEEYEEEDEDHDPNLNLPSFGANVSDSKESVITMTVEDKTEFICLLLADDTGALVTVASFLEAKREDEDVKPTEATHTLWVRQTPDQNGFYFYHVNHNLNSTDVTVATDGFVDYTHAVKDENTIVIASREDLWAVDVYVSVR